MEDDATAAPAVISGHWLLRILEHSNEAAVDASLDLGRTHIRASIEGGSVILPGGTRLALEHIRTLRFKPEDCFIVAGDVLERVYRFSEQAGRYYKLYQARPDWPPTVVINNAPMHAIRETSPLEDAARKLAAVVEARGTKDLTGAVVLDACFGLGYTALTAAALGAARVVTCELDANVLEIARVNPWSRAAFANPCIERFVGDSREVAARAPAGEFDVIIHDPPTLTLAGEMYADALYIQFRRILRSRGTLYHYTGSPGGRLGRNLPARVARRLADAGFRRVKQAWGGVVGIV